MSATMVVGMAMAEALDGATVEVVGGEVGGARDTEAGGGAQDIAVAVAVEEVDPLEVHEPPQVKLLSVYHIPYTGNIWGGKYW